MSSFSAHSHLVVKMPKLFGRYSRKKGNRITEKMERKINKEKAYEDM